MGKGMRFWLSLAIVSGLMAFGELQTDKVVLAQPIESTSPHQEQAAIQKLLNFQTANYAIRLFQKGHLQYLDVYEKSRRDLLLIQVPVVTQRNATETTYRYQSNDRTYTIRVAATGNSFEIRTNSTTIVKEPELPLQPSLR